VEFLLRGGFVPNSTKHDLIVDVSKSTGLTQADTKIAVEELLGIIAEILETGKNIEIRGFGTFYTKIRKPRPARNPKTGEVVPLLKRIVPLFKYSSEFKESIAASIKEKNIAEVSIV
jgi:DNA-binding protein HU-beta/integration host factor subunit beta